VEIEFGLSRIGQIALPVHDLDAAVQFYRDTLGIKLLFQVPGLAFFDCDGVRLMLSVPESAEFDRPGSVIYYKVSDLDSAFEILLARGVEFVDKPHRIAEMEDHDLWMAFFRDLDGNLLALMSEVLKKSVGKASS
jgi:catechol 2,3-dioxygenase-like lactoylglutathione lyase family enzyme